MGPMQGLVNLLTGLERAPRGSRENGAVPEPPTPRRAEPRRYTPPEVNVPLLVFDAVMLIAASVAAVLAANATDSSAPSVAWLTGFSALTILFLGSFGLYQPQFISHYLDDVRAIIAGTAIAAMALSFIRILGTDDANIADQAVRVWIFATAYMVAGRGGLAIVRARRLREGEGGQRTLIIGAGRVGRLVASRLGERPQFGLEPVAFLDHDPLDTGDELPLPVFGGDIVDVEDPTEFSAELEAVIESLQIDHVI